MFAQIRFVSPKKRRLCRERLRDRHQTNKSHLYIYACACVLHLCVMLLTKPKESAHVWTDLGACISCFLVFLKLFLICSQSLFHSCVVFVHVCVCDYVNQIQDGTNRKSPNSIYKFVRFVCVHLYVCRCVRECEIVRGTQCSAKDNKKFPLDRGGSHESGAIPVTLC